MTKISTRILDLAVSTPQGFPRTSPSNSTEKLGQFRAFPAAKLHEWKVAWIMQRKEFAVPPKVSWDRRSSIDLSRRIQK